MKSFLQPIFFLFLFSVVLFSCDNFDDVPANGSNDIYLVSHEKVSTHSLVEINILVAFASIQFPDLAAIGDKFVSPVDVYKISYYTTFEGEKRKASGLVCVPSNAGTYPLMSFQNGTNTLHSAAPSVAPDSDLFQLLGMMASSGFVIAIPDYLGFGVADDMFHPYLDKESTVQTVLDMLRATKEMVEKLESTELNEDLYITGYSQGGWSTMQVQKAIESNYSGEFNLVASACGAGPYDLVGISNYVFGQTTYPMPYFLGYLINSYSNLGMTTPIDSMFKEPYASRIPGLFDGSKDGAEINTELTKVVGDLFTTSFLDNWESGPVYSSFYSMLQDNSISGYKTKVPTLLIHGSADTFVPSFTSQNLYNEFITQGVNSSLLYYIELPGLDHQDAVVPAELQAIKWFLQIKEGEITF